MSMTLVKENLLVCNRLNSHSVKNDRFECRVEMAEAEATGEALDVARPIKKKKTEKMKILRTKVVP